jgi:ATP-dependent RNA helicase RhlE
VSSTAEAIQQAVYFVEKSDKKKLLTHLLKDKTLTSVLVFTRTKHGADKVVKDLVQQGISALAIHGNKSQNARQNALNNFKAKKTRVLVATDIAARGIDIDLLSYVVNYELPNVPETYVHRIGRTGRAGASGIALSFCDTEEIEYLRDIQKLIGKSVPIVGDHPYASKGGPVTLAPAHSNGQKNAAPKRQSKEASWGGKKKWFKKKSAPSSRPQ